MILLDANILVSAMLGTRVPRVLAQVRARGVTLAVTAPQIVEAARVLIEKIGMQEAEAHHALAAVISLLTPIGEQVYAPMEASARRRLHDRAQSDWPLLAAALASSGAIWSEDRDFFGVGVPVWSSRNMQYAE
ncbi:MAG: PIN domain-containing protein [Micropepsaceae bacterium]